MNRFMLLRISHFFLISLAVGITGCGGGVDDAPDLYPVKGTIKKDGKAIQDVRVSLVPAEDGIPAVGVSGEDGSFELSNPKGGKGAQAGTYKVVLSVTTSEESYATGGDPNKAKLPFPKSYTSKTTTPKIFDVKEGDNVLEIVF
ncbi:carboxypeptidase regulatory-like domain-containing protein [Gimesia panareensis]|uniref:carboxypeptidase regulatory-like domain-containing protein n=1 Tax=Gimesia panareensis TaxID=2527978 RepID=UPI001189AFCD|nr:carboxypeptidase regulatory-like domain-containing protein [Gimesia panareensis]QDU49480.1 hypothetical protein Pan110_18170 [Gimesia panareensis]